MSRRFAPYIQTDGTVHIKGTKGTEPIKEAETPRLGRPPVADIRKIRCMRFNDQEWAAVKARAAKAGLGIADYVRRKSLGKSLTG